MRSFRLLRAGVIALRAAGRWSVLLGGVMGFAALATELHQTRRVGFDEPVQRWLERARSATRTRWMRRLTRLGNVEVLTGVAGIASVALWSQGRPEAALFVAATGIGAGLVNEVLKQVFRRARPVLDPPMARARGFAFPSGHSMGSAAVYGSLAMAASRHAPALAWPARAAAALVVGAVGVSRAYLHVHYPSDVLAGWGLGLSWPLWLAPLTLTR